MSNFLIKKQSLITAIQPTGSLHLGSYLGTMTAWKQYAREYQCWFFIADMHAITMPYNPSELEEKTLSMAAIFLAMGLDTENISFFVQSQVPQHAELGWVLSCIANTGEMNRMTQYKDKAKSNKQPSSLGLYAYPCLMAADILLYDAKFVPVGDDQKQHLELTRNLAQRFNRDFSEVLVVPDPVIPKIGARVMALGEPEKKMSKSDSSVNNTIFLLDKPEVIAKKIKRAVTDSQATVAHDPARPGISNLVSIYAALADETIEQTVNTYHDQGYAVFKKALIDQVVAHLEPLQERYHTLRQDEKLLRSTLARGAQQARQQASKKLAEVYKAVGFMADAN